MTFDEYQQWAKRTMDPTLSVRESLMCFGLGIAGEAGEVADHIKKVLFHGKLLSDDALQKELGDVLWYIAGICTAKGWTLEEIAAKNVQKLVERYPNGFERRE